MAARPAELCRLFLSRHFRTLEQNGVEVALVLLDENASKSKNLLDHALKVSRRQAAKAGCSTVMGFLKIATYKLLASSSNSAAHIPELDYDFPLIRVDNLNSQAARDALTDSRCDLVCLMGTRILTKKTLSSIACPIINIHSSDPRFMRGSPTVVWEILAGDDAITLTIHRVVPELDSGAILGQAKVPIEFRDGLRATVSRTMANSLPTATDLFLETILAFKDRQVTDQAFQPGPLRVTPRISQTFRAEWLCRKQSRKR